ncbi:hypothetical protein ELI49_16410 [Rhizobium ruizarguesonis]|nr:hypothetical protein ELI49_16410 [Rhizobium ruizarguesonis]TAW78843.1 hypothetical protein ELI10_17365 [Rhizobium ruizarguesonis]TAX15800.1 hypothetical protein ELI09_17365 [Rhizobium ruizarguesonis]TAX20632.1 hypothetical protein ELI08_17375 [Rhizobium ruizarguesonis]TBA86551.1 hypothetical protein ELH53_16740 [Rhizobium ruizarguesonis]
MRLEQFQQKCAAVLRPELREQGDRAFPWFEEKRKCSQGRRDAVRTVGISISPRAAEGGG